MQPFFRFRLYQQSFATAMTLTQKFLSYFFPFTRKITSEFSGELEITVSNGRKVLDSLNANYSYGSLQRILKFGLAQVSLPGLGRVLLLGLGGGSAVATLRLDFGFKGHITAVDIDPVVISIARDEFGIIEAENLQIVCADAFTFVKTHPARFDLIIVDLFIDNQVPAKFLAADFWQDTCRLLRPAGHLIFNTIGPAAGAGAVQAELERLGLHVREFAAVERTNTLLIASRP
ncbi:spermidine synthase [Hymenobacter ruricola]|uniref:Fused MFS/spermidine synthase n=1 Tax=Hymenobacter ruricola TaxID=2791023 RepID=A0ABS0I370_9BACT|nr:fused MFS/spermidine synthase [Hymenobacter ruricola]MBF9221042.1 fused MFS/spermidine synthase [Hymenobacter ruricola]